jgi:hypothetical protein
MNLVLDKGHSGMLYVAYVLLFVCIEVAGNKKCEMASSFCIIQNSGKERQFMFIT